MATFLDNDGDIMAQEIDELTEENYKQEKDKLIRIGKMKVDQVYNKKTKRIQTETQTKIASLMTSAKLEVLWSKDKHITSVLADVNKELMKLRCNKKLYRRILKKLILQALFKILEKEVDLMVAPGDVACVESMVDKLKKTYIAQTGMDIKINIENCSRLPTSEAGVKITVKSRKYSLENTLMTRVIYLNQEIMKIIRN